MTYNELLDSRRSVRAYSDKKVSREDVEAIIAAAQKAPSWKNSQTGRYYAVMDKENLELIKSNCLPPFNQKNSANAPVLIVTAFERGIAGFDNDGQAVNELGNCWGAYDLGLQNMAMLLKATELGLDTLIMGIRNENELRNRLSIPETQAVVSVIALGYRDIDPKMPPRKKLEEILKIT